MKQLLAIWFMLTGYTVLACQCPVTSLTEKETNKYELIFRGKISSVKLNGEHSEALFHVDELYKGNSTETFKVLFNDLDACKLELRVGDEWIIYTNYIQIDKAKLDFCSRSRKHIANIKEDFFEVNTGMTYDEELAYLQANLGLHKLLKDNPDRVQNRNIIPNTRELIITLLFSIAGLVLFYWIIRRVLK